MAIIRSLLVREYLAGALQMASSFYLKTIQ